MHCAKAKAEDGVSRDISNNRCRLTAHAKQQIEWMKFESSNENAVCCYPLDCRQKGAEEGEEQAPIGERVVTVSTKQVSPSEKLGAGAYIRCQTDTKDDGNERQVDFFEVGLLVQDYRDDDCE